jgi:glycosyltransferase involved in cell wall biosynthesis
VKRLDAVVPIYNEADILSELDGRLRAVLSNLDFDWRIIYVDDGSVDGSGSQLAAFARDHSQVSVVHLSRNFGQQLAIAAGLAMADADAVVLLDGDLQDPPEVIPSLVEKWQEGHDVVYAVKRKRKESWLKRKMFSLFYVILRRMSSVDIPADAGNFSLMDRSVVELINSMPERSRYVSGLRAYVGGRQVGVEFERAERFAGDPRQSPRRLIRMALDAFFAFSELPLKLASFMGFVVSGIAFFVMLTVLYKKLILGGAQAIPGWASTMTSILFLGGIQLMSVGIIGEYIGRIYNETKARPAWVVSRYRNLNDGHPSSAPTALHDSVAGD